MPVALSPRELIDRLIAFATTSAKSNLALIDFVADYLDGHGVSSIRVENDEGTKANLIASIGPERAGGVVLSGHTDVVPVAGQQWRTDPFEVAGDGDRLHGRGTADMKSFIAVALSLVPEFLAWPLRRPIHLAFSYDEEIGCLGAPRLLDRLRAVAEPPAAAIIGEPTEMKVVSAHRGASLFTTTVTGRPGHSSQPDRGVNAIETAAACIGFLGALGQAFRDEADAAEARFDPPYATLNVGVIEGGTATNIIAEHCRFHWGCRTALPEATDAAVEQFESYTARELLPAMQALAPEAAIETEAGPRVPPLIAEPGSVAETLALSLTGDNSVGTIALASEAGMFQAAGIPSVLCGPGSPRQAHQADEFVEWSDVEACEAFLRGAGNLAAAPLPENDRA